MEEGVIREGVKESQTIIGGSEEMQAPLRSNSGQIPTNGRIHAELPRSSDVAKTRLGQGQAVRKP